PRGTVKNYLMACLPRFTSLSLPPSYPASLSLPLAGSNTDFCIGNSEPAAPRDGKAKRTRSDCTGSPIHGLFALPYAPLVYHKWEKVAGSTRFVLNLACQVNWQCSEIRLSTSPKNCARCAPRRYRPAAPVFGCLAGAAWVLPPGVRSASAVGAGRLRVSPAYRTQPMGIWQTCRFCSR